MSGAAMPLLAAGFGSLLHAGHAAEHGLTGRLRLPTVAADSLPCRIQCFLHVGRFDNDFFEDLELLGPRGAAPWFIIQLADFLRELLDREIVDGHALLLPQNRQKSRILSTTLSRGKGLRSILAGRETRLLGGKLAIPFGDLCGLRVASVQDQTIVERQRLVPREKGRLATGPNRVLHALAIS